jgi:hypothetical protein
MFNYERLLTPPIKAKRTNFILQSFPSRPLPLLLVKVQSVATRGADEDSLSSSLPQSKTGTMERKNPPLDRRISMGQGQLTYMTFNLLPSTRTIPTHLSPSGRLAIYIPTVYILKLYLVNLQLLNCRLQ